MFLAELDCKSLSCITFVDNDPLHTILSNIDVNVKLWVTLIHSVLHLIKLLVNQLLRILVVRVLFNS